MAIEFFEILPLYDESEEDIRTRMDANVNQGIAITSDEYADTRQGSMYWDHTQPAVIELAGLWDALSTEVIAAAYIGTSFGDYLDNHAADLNLERTQPAPASGTVLFTGTPGALVPAQLTVSTLQVDPDIAPRTFLTQDGGVISTQVTAPTAPSATGSTSSGNLPSGTYYYKITALNDYGETIASAEVSATIGTTGKITTDWDDMAGATSYRVYRGTSAGTEKLLRQVVNSTYVDAGQDTIDTSTAPPGANTTAGKFRTTALATDTGSAGNVAPGAIVSYDPPQVGIASVTNDVGFSGGEDLEDDESLRERCLLEIAGGGGGNVTDYKRWALAYPGVGRVTVVAHGNGPGTVLVIIQDNNGDPVSQLIIDGLQNQLDPLAGQGEGDAPIGHTVTVLTPATVVVAIASDLIFESGFSLDGGAGTAALRDTIEASLSDYINNLDAGADVVYDRVQAAIYKVPGIVKVNTLTINGGTSDVTVTSSPAQVARLGVVTLNDVTP